MVHASQYDQHEQRPMFAMAEDGNKGGRPLLRKRVGGGVSMSSNNSVGADASNSTTTTEGSTSCDHSRGLSSCTSSSSSQRTISSQTTSSTTLQWWQRCTIRQAVSFLEQDIQHVISESPFLQRHQFLRSDDEKYPQFHRSEIITGELLGQGGFSDVYEVIGFELDDRVSQRLSIQQQKLRLQTVSQAIDPFTGRGRYAIKHLQERLIQKRKSHTKGKREFELAASDLVVEVAYLSALDHPNILAIRGLPFRGIRAFQDGQFDSFFFLCDRLQDTLDKRINEQWQTSLPTINQKANYALQLANALQYLHKQRIVFRDLKPQNIGFSVDNQEKVLLFDFGLCRELPTDDMIDNVEMMYEMSGVGTRRYMAPEVVNESRYNLKADVYSWSMVFWEILTHTKPYASYSFEEHRVFVCRGGERPSLDKELWPDMIQHILTESWKDSVTERLTMEEVAETLSRMLQKVEVRKNQSTYLGRYVSSPTPTDSNLITHKQDIIPSVIPYESLFCVPHCTDSRGLSDVSTSSTFESSNLRFKSNPDWLASLTDDVDHDDDDDDEDVFDGLVDEYEANNHVDAVRCCNDNIRELAAFAHSDGVEVQLASPCDLYEYDAQELCF